MTICVARKLAEDIIVKKRLCRSKEKCQMNEKLFIKKTIWLLPLILAIICFIYSGIIYGTHSGTASFLLWIGLGILFLLWMLLIKIHFFQKCSVLFRRILYGVIVAVLAVFVVTEGCILSGFFQKGEAGLSHIVVLGAQVRESGPSLVLKYRLDCALEYLEENPETVCIVSGGQGKNEPWSEAQGMYEYLVERGISPTRVIKEENSFTTDQNLKNSSELLDKERDTVGIITNNFHVFRAVQLAKHMGISHAEGIAAKTKPLYLPNNMLREFFGVMKDLVRGNLFCG